MSQDDVAAGLMVDLVSHFLEHADSVLAGADGQAAHADTSTTSSVIGGGIGSLCFLRLAR